jgi:hypothetical protein
MKSVSLHETQRFWSLKSSYMIPYVVHNILLDTVQLKDKLKSEALLEAAL